METTVPTPDPLDQVQTVTTSLARHARSLDERLTLVMVRMVCVSLAFGGACFVFGMIFLQIVDANGMWKPKALHQPSIVVGSLEMALVVGSWIVFFWGQWAGLYAKKFGFLTLTSLVAALMGLAAVATHIYELHQPGFHLQSAYAGIFVVTEAVYTTVIAVAVVVLFGIANRARLRLFVNSGVAIEAFSEFWGFLAAIAVFNFVMLYIQPFINTG